MEVEKKEIKNPKITNEIVPGYLLNSWDRNDKVNAIDQLNSLGYLCANSYNIKFTPIKDYRNLNFDSLRNLCYASHNREFNNNLDYVLILGYSHKNSNDIIRDLIRYTGLPISFLANVFDVTEKTMAKYKTEKKKLSSQNTELAVKLGKLYILGEEIFGDKKEFNDWLRIENRGLGNMIPIDMLNTVTGIDLVIEELKRIEFGATA